MDTDGTTLQSYMRPFPESELVFASDIELHRRHFLPLMSLDASAINPAFSGLLHVVSVKETYDGAVGEHCREFHTDLCKDNQVAFGVDKDGRYTFLGDFRFFAVERGHKPGSTNYVHSQSFVDEIIEHYEQMETSFEAVRAFYWNTGRLNPNSDRQPDRKDRWLHSTQFYNNYPAPILPNGRALQFVTRASGWSYCAHGADSVSLYFDPVDRIAVVRFDFS
jgi:hypothetical protein